MTAIDVGCEAGYAHDVLTWRDVDLNETSRIGIGGGIAAMALRRRRGGCRRGVDLSTVESEEGGYVVRRGHECARKADARYLRKYVCTVIVSCYWS